MELSFRKVERKKEALDIPHAKVSGLSRSKSCLLLGRQQLSKKSLRNDEEETRQKAERARERLRLKALHEERMKMELDKEQEEIEAEELRKEKKMRKMMEKEKKDRKKQLMRWRKKRDEEMEKLNQRLEAEMNQRKLENNEKIKKRTEQFKELLKQKIERDDSMENRSHENKKIVPKQSLVSKQISCEKIYQGKKVSSKEKKKRNVAASKIIPAPNPRKRIAVTDLEVEELAKRILAESGAIRNRIETSEENEDEDITELFSMSEDQHTEEQIGEGKGDSIEAWYQQKLRDLKLE